MAMWLADIQISNGDEFGFEHPGLSLAWGRDSVTKLHRCLPTNYSQLLWLQKKGFGAPRYETFTSVLFVPRGSEIHSACREGTLIYK